MNHDVIRIPTLAIIIPILNEREILLGLLAQCASLDADECIIVDGGSDDGSIDILAQSGIKHIQCMSGRAMQMNAGAAQCAADILIFVHADTIVAADDIRAVKYTMQAESMVGGRFDVRLSGKLFVFRVIEFFINWRSRLTKISTGDQAMFVRRDVFEKLGGFPVQSLMEDVEFSSRLKQEGSIACLRNKVVTSSRRWEAHGIVRTVFLMWWLRFRYWLGADPATLKRSYTNT